MANKLTWTPEEIQEKADAFRENVRKECEDKGLDLSKVVERLNEELDAAETKAHYDPMLNMGQWVYSDPLIAHNPRLKAIDIALKLLDAYPAEKRQVSGPGGGPIPVKYEDIDPKRKAKIDKILDYYYGKQGKK